MNASSIPFKVCIPSRGPARIGIAASSYAHLRQIVRYKYKVSGEFSLQQEDGTIVCDEDYFRLLEPKTTLTVMESPPPFPPLQHAASTAAALAGYQPLCPNHCWPRPSVAAVAGEKNSRAVVHSTICLSLRFVFSIVFLCYRGWSRSSLSPALSTPFADCGAGVRHLAKSHLSIVSTIFNYTPVFGIWDMRNSTLPLTNQATPRQSGMLVASATY